MDRITRIKNTPWGPAQRVRCMLPGQVFAVDTASHGGLYVAGAALDKIPPPFRQATFTKDEHWYDEDVDFAIVARFVPEAFGGDPGVLVEADLILRKAHAEAYARWEAEKAAN
jgi:hypothetical protein